MFDFMPPMVKAEKINLEIRNAMEFRVWLKLSHMNVMALILCLCLGGGCVGVYSGSSASRGSELKLGEEFSARIKTVPGGGHIILAEGKREFDILLSDFRAPKKGSVGDARFIEVLNRIVYPPIFCKVVRLSDAGTYALCLLEKRVSLGDFLRQLKVPEADEAKMP